LAEISPLRGVRFNPARSGPLGPLLAPPYDVAKAPENGAELNISHIENVNLGVAGDQHAHAARQYRAWLADGILAPDANPGFYIHRHQFLANGALLQRTGLIARVRLQDWDDRVILPHEKTMPGPRSERQQRLRTVGANLSPLYFLYRDPIGEACGLFAQVARKSGAVAQRDGMGGTHELAQLTDPLLLTALITYFGDRSLFVADGHHRYEAALEHRNEMRQRNPGQDGPWEYVLALLAAVEDPGVQVCPTHRILAGDSSITPEHILEVLNRWFEVRPRDSTAQSDPDGALFRLILPGSPHFYVVLPRRGEPHLALAPRNRGVTWRSLGVAAVESVLEALLGAKAADGKRRIIPVVDEQAAIQQVVTGHSRAAFLLPMPSLDRILAVAEEGDLLPPKSTWFEPKAPAGLVINDLTLSAPE
jgi:uncharacterized protein (DUF1015 family)